MIHSGRNLKRVILVAGDVAVFELSLVITLAIRYGSVTATAWNAHVWPFSIVAILWVVGFYVAGLYDLALLRDPLRFFRTYLEGMIANLAVAVAFFYLIPVFGIAPRTNLFFHFVIALLLGYFWRLVFNRFIMEKFARGRVLYVGPAEEAVAIDQLLKQSSLGLDLVAAIPTRGEPNRGLALHWYGGVPEYDPALREENINTVVVGEDPGASPELRAALYKSLLSPITLLDRAEIEEVTTGRIPLSYVTETWFLQHLRERDKTWYEAAKRAGDILLAIPFGLITLVIVPFVAVIMKLTAPGPLFYSQIRVGKNGKQIKIWKFRSMVVDAEKNGAQFTASTATDPRVTPFGRFMRKTRIDELPQLWNVLRGDLSFIGPRPERPEFVAPLTERMPYYALRHLTRPGLTGWAQVMFLTPTASLEDNLRKLQYDLFYIKHRSLMLDGAILLKTIGIVLRRQGT